MKQVAHTTPTISPGSHGQLQVRGTFGSALSDGYAALMSSNKDETAVHGFPAWLIWLCACVR